MGPDDRDDQSFADAMAQLGVVRLDERAGSRVHGRSQKTGSKKSPRTTGGSKQRQSPPPPGGQKKTPRTQTATADQRALVTTAELDALRADVRQAKAEVEALRAERAAWHEERTTLEQRFERERAEAALRAREERTKASEQARETRQRLAAAESMLAMTRSLSEALRARGCSDQDECIAVVRGLLEVAPDEFLDNIEILAPTRFARLLDQRVAFVASCVDMEGQDSCVVIRVPGPRCEVTGGSDIQAGFRRFTNACARAGIGQVTIVGGSPAYRRQLERLAHKSPGKLRLNLVSGTTRRTKHRAKADARKSDLIIIWGGTELDHSVTSVYTSAPDKTLRVPHRGISRMLVQVAEELLRRKS